MSTARLFVEAVDTVFTLAHAVYGWLLFLATVAAILLLAAVACGAWAVDALLDRLCGYRTAADSPGGIPEPEPPTRAPHEPPARHTPAWAHTQPIEPTDDYQEAA